MTAGLRVYCGDITPDKILHLNLVPDNPLPHDCLPLVWFVGNTLHHLWKLRSAGKQTHLYLIRAELEAQISKYADIRRHYRRNNDVILKLSGITCC